MSYGQRIKLRIQKELENMFYADLITFKEFERYSKFISIFINAREIKADLKHDKEYLERINRDENV